MIIRSMRGGFLMGLFRKDVLEVLTPFGEDGLGQLGFLGDLGQDGNLSNGLSCKPSFSFLEALGHFEVGVHSQPLKDISLRGKRVVPGGEALTERHCVPLVNRSGDGDPFIYPIDVGIPFLEPGHA